MAASTEEKLNESVPGLKPLLTLGKVQEATAALLEYMQKKNTKNLLFEDEGSKIGLQLTFKKAPKIRNKCIKIALPHSIRTDTTEVCLFVKDLDPNKREYNETVNHFKDLLAEKGVKCVSNVIPVKSLKTEYKQFEAKWNLSNMYDIYLADARIVSMLPKLLGKSFYGRRRHPIQVNLQNPHLAKEIHKVVDNTRLHLTGRGTSCLTTVAHTTMAKDQIAENVFNASCCVAQKIPGGPHNVQQLFLTCHGYPSLPLYLSTESGKNVVLPSRKKVVDDAEPEEVTTVEGAKVKVNKRFDIILVPDNGTVDTEKNAGKGKRKHSKSSTEPKPKKSRISKRSLSKGKNKYDLVKQPKKSSTSK